MKIHPFKRMFLIRHNTVQEVAIYQGLSEVEATLLIKAGLLFEDRQLAQTTLNHRLGGVVYKSKRQV